MKTKKTITVELQLASQAINIPPLALFEQWAHAALIGQRDKAILCIRIVDEPESAELNTTYRHKQGPTNVLSFPFEPSIGLTIEQDYLGDMVICAPIVQREAKEQAISDNAHWAHMTVHGVLHLLGFDHINEQDAALMEQLEAKILMQLGFNNPYDGA
ncbi:MAG: metal-dependent hydrolase [Gammaproteobacteria bacterium]|jgi:probable rRNA maturation factor|nr:metal-dependent hydrolase [Gammaproteobacteria bacterium]